MRTYAPARRGPTRSALLVTAVLLAAVLAAPPALAADTGAEIPVEPDESIESVSPTSAEGSADHAHGAFDPRNAQLAPPVEPGSRAADPRAYAAPGWLPFRGQQRLGCVTTNCNGGGHSLWAIDIAFATNQPIYASGSGRVYLTVTNQGGNCNQALHPTLLTCPPGSQGNAVLIDHGNNVYSFYGHIKNVAVTPGQMITDGTMIASAGTSGWSSPQYPHLHYEEWQGLTWAGGVRTPPRALKACHGSSTVTYPNVGGSTSWNGLPGFGVWLRHDGKCNPNGPTCITGFYDVPAPNQFCTPIAWMVDSDITNGYGDKLFHPSRTVSRQSAVAWLHRLAGAPEGPFGATGFTDVPGDHPFRQEIAWAVSEGITSGFTDGRFRGELPVTRGQFSAYLHRMAGNPQGPFPDPGLVDAPPGSPFYLEISWAIDEGVAKGYTDDTFRRGTDISRAGGSTFLWRYDRFVP